VCFFLSFASFAKEIPFDPENGKFLIVACQETLEIYKNREERNFMAAEMTSAAEAIRAGYCIGYLQRYIKDRPRCGDYRFPVTSNWFELAKRVANVGNLPKGTLGTAAVLDKAYCNAY
jgi:hypothetical protein